MGGLLRLEHYFLDVAQAILAEENFVANVEGRRAEGAALYRAPRVLD